MTDQDQDQWHLDKRVPVAIIFAIAMQTGGALWWAASLQSRVENTERSIITIQAEVNAQRNASQTQAVQLGRIEEQVDGLRSDFSRFLNAFERGQRP